ncbi:hypothetical protein [Embleya sp. NPDC056538]|uniref:hypothetical protein n=1 Tax=Embleya sp. NPDC056538 TaxID=3345858 RepID=UPI0036BDE07E
MHRVIGAAARAHEATGEPIVVDAPVAGDADAIVVRADPYRFAVGLRSEAPHPARIGRPHTRTVRPS